MADTSSIGGMLSPMKDAIMGGGGGTAVSGGGGALIWLIGIVISIAVLATIGAFVWFFYIEKKKWNLVTRVHYENPTINGISIGGAIPTRRVRFKDGKVVYLYKFPIQGYTISPELLIWTRPREHDIVVTQDKKLFCLIGIENIDVKRKKLNVDISHPDIEMDRQDLQHHIDSKKYDDPNEKLKLIAKAATWIFIMTTIIVLAVLGGNAYKDGKALDIQRDQLNVQVSANMDEVMESVTTYTKLIQEILPELNRLRSTNPNRVVFTNSSG